MHLYGKSLWIKASAKCINVSVKRTNLCAFTSLNGIIR